jgi:FtsP/CotA-like multicopper oxidase with cupredoxin domain
VGRSKEHCIVLAKARIPGLLLATLACCVSLSNAAAQHHHSPAPAVFPSETAPGPPVLVNRSTTPGIVEVTLTAAPARLSLLPDAPPANAFAYNGRIPGPLLEVYEGDHVTIRFRNELPEPSTVHWHGMQLPFASDGSPFHPVPPGGEFDYVFTIPHGTAGTYWYHPHPHHRTGYQVMMGLFGALIVRDRNDPLPAAVSEKLLVLSDNRFLPDGSIDLPDPKSPQGHVDRENGREGPVLFVNGEVMPVFHIRSGEVQRWRVINATASRVFRLAIPGHSFLHVGDDGGLFERPRELEEIIVANSERVELLVRGTDAPGSQAMLQTLPYDRYVPQTRPPDWNRPQNLLTLQYTAEEPMVPPVIPDILRPVPPIDPEEATATRLMVLTQGMINGRLMDMERVDVSAPLGATEIWEIENLVGMDHPFHLHGYQFQVLDRNGIPVSYRSWKDTVNVPKHESARFIVRYDRYPGKWMFHCHILDHEDHGMMGVLEIK